MAYYSRPEEILGHLINLFKTNQSLLGINYVATQEESNIPEYPAIQVVSEPLARQLHAMQQFQATFFFTIWVYHANFEETFAVRSIADMKLATSVVRFLHKRENRALRLPNSMEDKVLAPAYVSAEVPGMINTDQGPNIITTRLTWQCKTVVNFDDA